MEDDLKLFITQMSEHAHYNTFLEKVGHHRPRVPRFDPIKGNEEEWKSKSGMQQGYDLLASLLNITFED
jgi:hypothetical protein